MQRVCLFWWTALVLGATLLATSTALAQEAVAQALFDEGKRLLQKGQTAAACEKFAASEEAKPSTGAMLNLAACHKKLGKTATAWAEFKTAVARARADGRQDRVDFAEQQAALLAPQLSKVVLSAPAEVKKLSDVRIQLDDAIVPTATLGTELPIDPGSHNLQVAATGHKAWSRSFTITGNNQRETIRIPALERLSAVVSLTIGRVPTTGDVTVSIDGRKLDPADYGRDLALAPGKHIVKALAPGYGSWTKTIILEEAGETARVDIPDLSGEEVTAPPSTGSDSGYLDEHTAPVLPRPRSGRDSGSGFNVVGVTGLVLTGLGGAAAAGGIVFGLVARSQAQTALNDKNLCPNYKCTKQGWPYIEASRDNATLATVLIPAGSAVALAGVGMMLFSGGSSGHSRASELPTPYYALDEFGLRYEGTF